MDAGSRLVCPDPGSDLTALLEERLTPDAVRCVNTVRGCSERTGVSACLVGGSVRDLLLGLNVVDLDVVVEGDGIAFAQELAGIEEGTAFRVIFRSIKSALLVKVLPIAEHLFQGTDQIHNRGE